MQTLAMILVAVEVILCVLIYFGCVYIRQRREHHQGQQIAKDQNTVEPSGPASATKNVLVFVPYSAAKAFLGKTVMNLTCANCAGVFTEDDETLRLIPTCGHVLHPTCLVDPCSPLCPLCQGGQSNFVGPNTKPEGGDDKVVNEKVVNEKVMRLSEEVTKKMILHAKLVLPTGKLCSPAQFITS